MLWVLPLAALALLAGAALLFAFNPASSRLLPPCPFHALTGLYCPGCGSTRACHHLLHGRIATAFDFNPLMVVSLPFIAYGLARQAVRLARGSPPPPAAPSRLSGWWIWGLLVVVLAFAVARNLPWKPVRWMAP
jgi:hypothetical protein